MRSIIAQINLNDAKATIITNLCPQRSVCRKAVATKTTKSTFRPLSTSTLHPLPVDDPRALLHPASRWTGFDTAIIGFIASDPVQNGAWKISLGPVMSAALDWSAVSALTAGPLADRIGPQESADYVDRGVRRISSYSPPCHQP